MLNENEFKGKVQVKRDLAISMVLFFLTLFLVVILL